jgi:glycosyltransferase involved in cell wall biosynthesis
MGNPGQIWLSGIGSEARLSSLVSCITPTFNRREFWPRCIECFQRQDYPDLEWVIVDDGTDPIKDLLPSDPRIRYHHELPKRNHGEKMNRCCELAKGEFVIVFDDDDWYAPDRITRQVAPFADPNVLVTGTSRLYYYLHGTKQAYRYHNWTQVPWLAAFALRKSVWENRKFDPLRCGADTSMIKSIPPNQRGDLNDLSLLVASLHPNNASAKNLPNASFIETPWEEIEGITKGTL